MIESSEAVSSAKQVNLGPRLRLVLLSFLMLFLELALIRWAGSEVIHLSFFTNFVLLGSFLGIGIGFLRAKDKRDLFWFAPIGLAALAVVVELSAPAGPEFIPLSYFGATPGGSGLPVWVVLPAIFLSVAAVMALVGQGVGRAFLRFEPLEAYRLDVCGSLAGVAVFSLLSFLGAPPLAWGGVVVALFLLLLFPKIKLPVVGCALLLVVLGIQSFAPDTYFSPYAKIELQNPGGVTTSVFVNGKRTQYITPLSQLRRTAPIYFAPYAGRPAPQNVLIIGAGTGLDVAAALAQNPRHVDAVEVDPGLVTVGEALNPDRAYQDPRVSTHADDGRAFLERTDTKYDLILYSLPDSLTLVAGQSGLRLESFLFTREALESARDHLTPSGTFALYGYFPASWMTDRMASAMQQVFARPTCLPQGQQVRETKAGPIVVARDLELLVSPGTGVCEPAWQASGEVIAPPTDDHPFPYIRGLDVPIFYLYALLLILLVSVVSVRVASGPLGPMRGYLDLFFMGAAFLLLEAKSVVQFALLFGSTWFVNALVFVGILLVVLASIMVARRFTIRRPVMLYPLLFASLAIAWAVPPSLLLDLALPLRFVAAVLLAFTPVFLANLIFAERFRDVEASTVAFGANLLGAMVGGLLEYGALVTGYRALIVGAGVLYLLAFLFGRRYLAARSEGSEGEAPAPQLAAAELTPPG